MTTLAGVATQALWQAPYLLEGLQHRPAQETATGGATDEVVTGGTGLIRLAVRTDKGAGPPPQRIFHEDSFPRRLIALLFKNLTFSTSGRHRPKVTSESESSLYLSLYDLSLRQ